MRGTRLGKHERAWLLRAGPPHDPVVLPPLPTLHRRAVLTLVRKDLVRSRDRGFVNLDEHPDVKEWVMAHVREWLRDKRVPPIKRMRIRALERTPFGEELVALYRNELEGAGTRIRWDERVQEARDAAIANCPHPEA